MIRKTLSDRGQVTIPKQLRDRFGMKPGVELEFVEDDDQIAIRKAPTRAGIASLYGVIEGGARTDDLLRELRGEAELP